jgi:hypothetical protein
MEDFKGKDILMKKMILMIATVAALAATASAPVQAHRLHIRPGAALAFAAGAAIATAAAPLVVDPYAYEPDYYYAPAPLYPAPVIVPFRVHRHHWR